MSLEAATHINQLVETNPTGADPKTQGDDHIRLLKTVLKTDFAGITGPVTATHTELNRVVGVTSAIQTQLDSKAPLVSPAFTSVPTAPTAAPGTNTTQLATTAFVAAVAALLFSTGDAKLTYKTIADSGWIMADDGTIGSAASGATTRANADTEPLYTLLWTNIIDAWCAVSSGRGASAAADFAANKTLAIPKEVGRALAVAGSGSGLTPRVLGQYLGEETHLLTTAELPPHTHATNYGNSAGSSSTYSAAGDVYGQITSQSTGGNTEHNNMPPESFLNVMIKL